MYDITLSSPIIEFASTSPVVYKISSKYKIFGTNSVLKKEGIVFALYNQGDDINTIKTSLQQQVNQIVSDFRKLEAMKNDTRINKYLVTISEKAKEDLNK